MNKKIFGIMAIIIVIVTILTAKAFTDAPSEEQSLKIACGIKIFNSPIFVMEEMGLFQKYAPGAKLELIITESGNAINEALISKQIDAGVLGITHFLIGIEKNVPYKIMSPIGYSRMSVQTSNPNIKCISDISQGDKIAISSYTSIPAMFLYIMAEKYFGDYNALDNNIIIMNSEYTPMALINGSIDIHIGEFTPRLQVNEANCSTILEDYEIDELSYLNTSFCVFNEDFYNKNRDLYDAFISALKEAVRLLNDKDETALEIVSKKLGEKKETIHYNIENGYTKFYTDISGFDIKPFIDVAFKTGMISFVKPTHDIIFND